MIQFNGISCFALRNRKFPSAQWMKSFPTEVKNPATAILYLTFGESWLGLERFAEEFQFRKNAVTIHISNGPGRRAGVLYHSDFLFKLGVSELNSKLKEQDRRVIRAFKEAAIDIGGYLDYCPYNQTIYNNTTFYICPELEDNLSNEAWDIAAKVLKKNFKRGIIIRNPCKGGTDGGRFTERHGTTTVPPGGFWNLDGTSVDVEDGYGGTIGMYSCEKIWNKNSKAKNRLLWFHTQQGYEKFTNWRDAPPPRRRKFIVTKEAIDFSRRILRG